VLARLGKNRARAAPEPRTASWGVRSRPPLHRRPARETARELGIIRSERPQLRQHRFE
jgi:hypothetical protein